MAYEGIYEKVIRSLRIKGTKKGIKYDCIHYRLHVMDTNSTTSSIKIHLEKGDSWLYEKYQMNMNTPLQTFISKTKTSVSVQYLHCFLPAFKMNKLR